MRTNLSPTIFVLLCALAFAGGCAQQTGTLTKTAVSSLVFIGETVNARVTIDDRSFELTKDNAKNHFEILPGLHRVKIEKDGKLVVDRELLLSDRQTVEVAIP